MNRSSFSLPACLLLAASSLAAAQGIVIVEQHGPAQGEPTAATKIHAEGNRLFIETQRDGKKQGIVYLGDAKVMRMIDYGNKTYREMTEQDFQRMGDSMAQMRQMMDEKLKNMPPQQREMVEKMMKQKMGAMPGAGQAPSPVVYTKVASGQSVRQWKCDRYEGTRDGQKVWDVCAVDFAQFGVQPSDLQVFQSMAEMFKSMAPQGMDDMFKIGFEGQQNKQGFSGVPVERMSYRNGAPDEKFEITEVTHQNIDDALFEVPPGFEKKEMPKMGGPH
jgi:uncharacterized protein YneF (UPF0154 family)